MQEGKHVLLDVALPCRQPAVKRNSEAQLRTIVIVVEMSTLKSANNNVKCFSQHNLLGTTITKRPFRFSCCGKKLKTKTKTNKGGSFIEIMLSTSYTAKSSYVYMQNQNKQPPQTIT